jgi:hypothetical protein
VLSQHNAHLLLQQQMVVALLEILSGMPRSVNSSSRVGFVRRLCKTACLASRAASSWIEHGSATGDV